MQTERLNAYRVMWLLVFFDLPVETKRQKKLASGFRKKLLKDGFNMMQYSVYMRHCASHQHAEKHTKRVKSMIPPYGLVQVLRITDKQYGDILNYWSGQISTPQSPRVSQLELF
jgi:CRISPR-associated protein Cas2